MNIELWCIGKNSFEFVSQGMDIFASRLKHYTSFEIKYIEEPKKGVKNNPSLIKEKEGELVLRKLKGDEELILLDEHGKFMDSIEFAGYIEGKMIYGSRKIVFLIGGAFGFSESIYKKAKGKISFSKMTYSHQLIRLCFVEQLYRAYTIIRNEKYHNS